MFCENCGTQLNDDDVFCTKCGKRVVAEADVEDTASEKEEAAAQAVQTTAEATAEIPEEKAEEKPVETSEEKPVETPEEKPAEKPVEKAEEKPVEAAEADKEDDKGFFGKLMEKKAVLIPAAVILVVFLLVFLNFTSLANFALKTVLSPEKYYSHVEKAQIEEISSSVADIYDNAFLDNANIFDTSVDADVYVELGDDAKELIADYFDFDDTDWLNKVGLELNLASKDDVFSGKAAALLGKNQLISGAAVFDAVDGTVFLQVPELTEKYLGYYLEDSDYAYYYDPDEYTELKERYKELSKTFPDKKVIEKLTKRYLTIAVDNIDSVKKKKDTLEVEKIEQNCTVLRVRLNQTDMLNIMEAICEEAKDDKELLEVLSTVVSLSSYYEVDADEIQEEIIDEIEDMLDDIEDSRAYANSNQEVIMNVWVNGKGEVVGRDISYGSDYDKTEVKYYMPQKGKKYAMEMIYESDYDNFKITGTGKKTSSKLDGDFKVNVSGIKLAEISVKDYNIDEAKKGYLKGKFNIKPSRSVWNELGIGSASMLLSGYSLDIEADMGAKKSELSMALEDDGKVFAKLTASTSIGSGKKENVSESKAIMVENTSDLMDWIDEIDFGKFIKNINKTKLPVEFIEAIEDYCDYVENMPMF